jgi:phage terminase small subunit
VKAPRPPESLNAAGRSLWRAVLDGYDLDAGELRILELACQAADDAASARLALRSDGVVSSGRYGQTIAHPAVAIARQAEASVSRLLGQLNVIDPMIRPVRRSSTPGPKPARRMHEVAR